jgi:hypothetical protein
MWYKFTKHNSEEWVKRLPKLMSQYNHTRHSTTGMKPYKAIGKEKKLLHLQRKRQAKVPYHEPKLQLGDIVRLSVAKKPFDKGYEPNWTRELYTVSTVNYSKPITYRVTDSKGEELLGSFYESELQKSSKHMKEEEEA